MQAFTRKILLPLVLLITADVAVQGQKIFMTGDSHVFSKIYPQKVEEILRTEHPDMEFDWWAKNGICFYSFNSHHEFFDSILNFHPEILIVHLGTNGAYANNFTRRVFRDEMEKFYSILTQSLPDIKVVFVTPFTNKQRKYRKKGKWRVNYKNRDASDEIISFVGDHPLTFVVDNNKEEGMTFLNSRNLIRKDNVHLTKTGYNILGEHVATEILGIGELWASPDIN